MMLIEKVKNERDMKKLSLQWTYKFIRKRWKEDIFRKRRHGH